MYLKTLLLIFLVSLCLCTSNQKNRKLTPNHSYRMHNDKEISTESCFCFDNSDSNMLVSQLLDPKNNGLERVVMYLYRDLNTKEIKLYTPSLEKQYLIPDMTFEVGDDLITITNETVDYVFNKNTNVVLKPNNNIVTVDIPGPDTAGLINNEIALENGVLIPSIDTDNTENSPYIIEIGIENTDSDTKLPATNFINVENNVVDAIKDPYYYVEELSPESENEKYLYVNDENRPIPGQKSDEWYHNVYKYPNYYYPTDPTVFNYENYVIGRPITFDDWFTQQMKIFHRLEAHGDNNYVDIETLKMLVMKTLHDNNMYVRTDGVLTNSDGTVLNMSNLKLRPVLIGNSIKYEKFLQGTHRENTMSKELPFLETVLVTLGYPPKILGIIPLGKTYLPASSSSPMRINTLVPETVTKSTTVKKTHCHNGNECHSQIFAGSSYLNPQIEVTGKQKIISGLPNFQEIHHEYKPSETVIRNKGTAKYYINSKKYGDKQIVEPYNVHKTLDLKKNGRFPGNGLIKKLLGLLSDQPKKESDTTVIFDEISDKNKQIFNEQTGFFDGNYSEEGNYEFPGFRIIGGNAATSSGTPVSNKGRSGKNF